MLEALDCMEREEEASPNELCVLFSCLLHEDEWKVIIKALLVFFLLESLQQSVDPLFLAVRYLSRLALGWVGGRVPNLYNILYILLTYIIINTYILFFKSMHKV